MSRAKVPITVITGYLGAGKTTLVNHILTAKHGRKIAVIENEFGEVGIDDALVVEAKEEVVEMNNGCICCTVRGDLIRILNKLLQRRSRFDAILIETTGLADPAPVIQTFFVDEDIQASCALDAVLTVVDSKHITQHLDEVKPEGVENEAVEQIAFADKILLNKVDLVTDEQKQEVINRIKGINKNVDIIECSHSRVDLDRVLGIKAFNINKLLENEPDFLAEGADAHQHDERVTSVGIELEGSCDMDKLNDWLSTLLKERGADLFRSKGILALDGSDDKYVFQGVHMLLQFSSTADGAGRPWRPDERRVNRLVFIGKNLNREELTNSFKACLV